MAVWQFRAWLVPARAAAANSKLFDAIREGTTEPWAGEVPGWCAGKIAILGLAPAQWWDRDVAMWGTEDGHYVQETASGARLLETEIAVDARVVDADYLRRLARFVSELKAKLVTTNGQVVGSTEAEITEALRTSDAWRFVVDPERFLRLKGAD